MMQLDNFRDQLRFIVNKEFFKIISATVGY